MSNTGAPESEPARNSAPEPEATPARGRGREGAVESVNDRDAAERAEFDIDERAAGIDTVTIHRSPRYFRFMTVGGIAGVLVALILTFAFPEPPGFNPAQIFGFLGILFVVVGVVAGSVVALLIDRAARRRSKTIQIERIESVTPAQPDQEQSASALPVPPQSALDAAADPQVTPPTAVEPPDETR